MSQGRQARGGGTVSKGTGRATLLVGALGLVLTFAGSAAAGSLITSKQIHDGTITSADLRDGQIRGVDFRDGSLSPVDFGILPAGAVGDQGQQGLPGPDGVQGVVRRSSSENLLGREGTQISARCPAGTHVIGGGLDSDLPTDLYLGSSAPTGQGWTVIVTNRGDTVITVTAVAVCAA